MVRIGAVNQTHVMERELTGLQLHVDGVGLIHLDHDFLAGA